MKKLDELPECPVATTVSLIDSKWKILIIRNLRSRPWRFNELRRDLGVSQKVLTDSLRAMEEDGLINRTVLVEEAPLRVEYSLSDLGRSMKPIIDAMEEWGTAYKAGLLGKPCASTEEGDR
jgi:DNA-binding HxlR family transcriptional regulator